MSELPEGWESISLGEITDYITSGSRDWSKYYSDEGALFVRTQDINTNRLTSVDRIARVKLPQKAEGKRTLIRQRDLLITITGANVGKCANVTEEIPEAYVSQSVALVRLLDPSLARFVHYQLIAPTEENGLTTLQTSAYGLGRPVLNLNNVRDVSLRIPPLNEQQRIADKLDALLARVDACRERLDRVPIIIKRFRQAVLAAATSGRLTEEWRNNVGSSSDWETTDVQSVAAVGTGSTPLRSNSRFFATEGTPWITSAATSEPFVHDAHEFVTQEAISAHRLKKFPVGTLLVAMYGEGKTRGQVSELAIEATINQACAAVVVDESKAVRSFVKLALQANYLAMRELAEGGNQPNLNLSKIKEFELPSPSVTEQHEIVRRVETLFACADRLESRYRTARAAIDRLTPALLAKAFRGELVPQDPNDEPASVLLERIRAERESGATPSPKKERSPRKSAPAAKATPAPKQVEVEVATAPASAHRNGNGVQTDLFGGEHLAREREPRRTELVELPVEQVMAAFRAVSRGAGEMSEVELLRGVARRLGYERLTQSIREPLEKHLKTALRRKIVAREEDGYVAATPTIARYEDEFLLNSLLSVMRKGYEYEREGVMELIAEYLGYAVLTDAMRERMKGVVTKGIREGALGYRGKWIWKA